MIDLNVMFDKFKKLKFEICVSFYIVLKIVIKNLRK